MSVQKKAKSVMGKPSGSKNIKKGGSEHHQPQMKLVTSDTCVRCQSRCARGIAYMEKMSQPGAVGFGTPCPLTLK